MKRKLLTVLLSVLAVLCLCFGLAACGGGNKFSISTVEKISMGASKEQVESILGKPFETVEGDTKWLYYDSDFLSYADKAAKLDEESGKAFLTGDFAKLDKLMKEYDQLTEEMMGKRFSRIEVTFSSDKVTSVFFDASYSEEETSEKEIMGSKVFYDGKVGQIEKLYYTDYRTSENGVPIYEKDTTVKDSFSYATTFRDGSYYHAVLHSFTDDRNNPNQWTWMDKYGEHTADKPSNVTIVYRSIGKVEADGAWKSEPDTKGELIIPDGVTSIGEQAFYDCSKLTSIEIPASVTSIGSNAFYWCSELERITVSADNQNYSSQDGILFNKTKTIILKAPVGLRDVNIPDSVTEIGKRAFSGCSGLTSVTIPGSVTSIGSSAFAGCSGLTGELKLPDSVTTIGSDAFSGCSGFTGDLNIPGSVTSIGSSAFAGCSGFVNISVAAENAIYKSEQNCLIFIKSNDLIFGCKNSVIPDGVTSIGSHAFEGCSGLTGELKLPDSVTSIGSHAFEGCSGLTGELKFPVSMTSIGYSAFEGCSGLTGELKIPDSVRSIGGCAFEGCSGLTGELKIPNHVTSIEQWVFRGCSGLTSIVIPDGVTSIGDRAFEGCSGLTSIVIPDSVTWIEEWVFRGCSGLTSIVIPDGVTSIGDYVFYECSGLTSIVIPDSVTWIGNFAFARCEGLTDIQFKGTLEAWQRIQKYGRWNDNTGEYTVTCTDGTIKKDGTVTYFNH